MTDMNADNLVCDGRARPAALKIMMLSGDRGSGKDTLGAMLGRRGWTRISLADPLRDLASRLTGIAPRLFVDREAKDAPLSDAYDGALMGLGLPVPSTPRDVLLRVGDIARATLGDTVFVKAAGERIAQLCDGVSDVKVVVTDARTRGELEGLDLEAAHSLSMRDLDCLDYAWTVRVDGRGVAGAHSTDTEWKTHEFDAEVDNSGSLEDLDEVAGALDAGFDDEFEDMREGGLYGGVYSFEDDDWAAMADGDGCGEDDDDGGFLDDRRHLEDDDDGGR